MELSIEITTSRKSTEYIDISESFKDNIDEFDKYSFEFYINILEDNRQVGEICGRIFDENTIYNDRQDIVDIADMYNQDVYSAINYLIKSKIYKEELDEDLVFENPYLCYIERFYIESEYRKKGIAKYIFSNLYDILLYACMIHIKCFVIYPNPQIQTCRGWENLVDNDDKLKNIMINVIKKLGYKQIGKDSGFYAINCMKTNKLSD